MKGETLFEISRALVMFYQILVISDTKEWLFYISIKLCFHSGNDSYPIISLYPHFSHYSHCNAILGSQKGLNTGGVSNPCSMKSTASNTVYVSSKS